MSVLIRRAREADTDSLVVLRAQMFDDMGVRTPDDRWKENCRVWFRGALTNPEILVLVAEENGSVVASGMAELAHGAPGPTCPNGRTVHVSNVVTMAAFRGQGHGSGIMNALVDWASEVADRAELHASHDGLALYRRLGFKETANPAMRLPML